ncbi:hypothetical protein BX661DRAFT_194146 [Kickxella alabastrina]|uniref:uncharacterized protein n=1 Tax=Kickxella alabastrina TaxID=61397 RepID=UPI00221ED9DC|nr:uncharacterized protein BX661DRAFT_194146 [Kickxella alabastrina]KAI7825403.1 hypothetical protein BX661DRAFT_194146 [Kickxella alabastrina]
MRYTSAGVPRASTRATRCSSPPDRFLTSLSTISSILIGLTTSVWNCGFMKALRIFLSISMRTEPSTWGRSSAACLRFPASMRISVVFPVPFSPSRMMTCDSVNEPPLTDSLKLPMVLVIDGYVYVWWRLISSSVACSTRRNDSASSRKRMFSVGMWPSRKMLMPSRTE